MFLSKYGVARHIYIPVVKRAVVDFAVSADWTPVAGDVKISKDGGAAANVTNLPTAIAMGNGAIWDFSLTSTEMQAAQVVVTVADSATKAVEDTSFIIETHGHASGQFQVDLADGVRAGLTALPNAAANAAGGLPVSIAGALDLDEMNVDIEAIQTSTAGLTFTGAGKVDASVRDWVGDTIPARNVAGVPLVDLKYTLGTISPAAAGSVRADAVTGAVGSVTGAVGSVTGNVAGNVLGNVSGSVASVTAAVALTAGERISVADALLDRDMSVGVDSGSPTVRTVRQALRFLRNKWGIAAGTLTVRKEDDATASWTAAVTQSAGNPVSEVDPA